MFYFHAWLWDTAGLLALRAYKLFHLRRLNLAAAHSPRILHRFLALLLIFNLFFCTANIAAVIIIITLTEDAAIDR